MIRFITLTESGGKPVHVNVDHIRAVFKATNRDGFESGAILNIGTAANIPVKEKASVVLSRIDDAYID